MQIPSHVLQLHKAQQSQSILKIQSTPKLSISKMRAIDVEELNENALMHKLYILVQVYQIDWNETTQHLIVKDCNDIWLNLTILHQYINYMIDDWLIVKNPILNNNGILIEDSQDVIAINPFVFHMQELQQIDVNQLKEKGNQYYQNQQYRLAYEYYTLIINLNQLHETCYNNRAWCLYMLGYYAQAIHDLEEVLKINNQNTKAQYRKALCLIKLNNPQEAKNLLNQLPNCKTESEIITKLVECELMLRPIDTMQLLKRFVNNNEITYDNIPNYVNPLILRRKSKIGGLGMFATQALKKGTLLIVEHPMHKINKTDTQTLQQQDRTNIVQDIRLQALKNKQYAEKLFSLYDGSNSYSLKQIEKDYENQLQLYQVDPERIYKILQFNSHAFQTVKVFTKNKQIKYLDENEGLWYTLSQFNHNLIPNICYYFIGELLIVITANDIQQDEELFVQYHPPLNQKEYQKNLKSHNIPIDQQLVKYNQLWKMDDEFEVLKKIIKNVKASKNLSELTEYTINNPNVLKNVMQKYPIKYLKIIQTVCYELFQKKQISEYVKLKFEGLIFQFEKFQQCSTIQDFCMFLTVVSQQQEIDKNMVNLIFKMGIWMFGEGFIQNENSEELLFAFALKQMDK